MPQRPATVETTAPAKKPPAPVMEQVNRGAAGLRTSSFSQGSQALAPKSAQPAARVAGAGGDRLDLEKVKQWSLMGYETHLTADDRSRGATEATAASADLGQRAPLPAVPKQTYQRGAFAMTLEFGADGPVLSFAGTDPTTVGDLLADANATGVGFGQFADNADAVKMWLRMAHSFSGQRVTVVGHSLGGAHAQWAASFFPEFVGRVITMDAPGIATAAVDRLDAHNRERPPAEQVKSTHFVTDSGIGFAGERHTPGDVHWYSAGHRANVLPTTHSSLLFPTDWNQVGPAMDSKAWDKQVLEGGLEGNRDLGAGVGLLGNLLNTPRDMNRWRKLEKLSNPKMPGSQAAASAVRAVGGDRGRAVSGSAGSVVRNAGQAASAGWEAAKGAADGARRWIRGAK